MSSLITQISACYSTYYRCFKIEKFVFVSVVSFVSLIIIVFPLGYFFNIYGLLIGYFFVNLLSSMFIIRVSYSEILKNNENI